MISLRNLALALVRELDGELRHLANEELPCADPNERRRLLSDFAARGKLRFSKLISLTTWLTNPQYSGFVRLECVDQIDARIQAQRTIADTCARVLEIQSATGWELWSRTPDVGTALNVFNGISPSLPRQVVHSGRPAISDRKCSLENELAIQRKLMDETFSPHVQVQLLGESAIEISGPGFTAFLSLAANGEWDLRAVDVSVQGKLCADRSQCPSERELSAIMQMAKEAMQVSPPDQQLTALTANLSAVVSLCALRLLESQLKSIGNAWGALRLQRDKMGLKIFFWSAASNSQLQHPRIEAISFSDHGFAVRLIHRDDSRVAFDVSPNELSGSNILLQAARLCSSFNIRDIAFHLRRRLDSLILQLLLPSLLVTIKEHDAAVEFLVCDRPVFQVTQDLKTGSLHVCGPSRWSRCLNLRELERHISGLISSQMGRSTSAHELEIEALLVDASRVGTLQAASHAALCLDGLEPSSWASQMMREGEFCEWWELDDSSVVEESATNVRFLIEGRCDESISSPTFYLVAAQTGKTGAPFILHREALMSPEFFAPQGKRRKLLGWNGDPFLRGLFDSVLHAARTAKPLLEARIRSSGNY